MMMIWNLIVEDIDAAISRDPAARNRIEVGLLYPGIQAVLVYRIAHVLWKAGFNFIARALSQAARFWTGIEIHPGATIGRRFFIDHGMGVVIGETAIVGNDVTLYHGVTLGGVAPSVDSASQVGQKRHPTLEDNVIVGSGAQVLGPIVVGESARVGANAVVVKEVEPFRTVVGVPAKAMRSSVPSSVDKKLEAVPEVVGTDVSSSETTATGSTGTVSSLSSSEDQQQQPMQSHEPKQQETNKHIGSMFKKKGRCPGFVPYGTPCGALPDPVAREMCQMLQEMGLMQSRILKLEQQLNHVIMAGAGAGVVDSSDDIMMARKLSASSMDSSGTNPNAAGGGSTSSGKHLSKHQRKRSNSPENCFLKRHASWLDLKKFS